MSGVMERNLRETVNRAVVDHTNTLFASLGNSAHTFGWTQDQVRDQLALAAGDDVADAWVDWCQEASR